MATLTADEIDDTCIEIVDYIKKNHSQYYSRIKFMYLYGCRIGELFDNRILLDIENSKVNIIAQKNNNIRQDFIIDLEVPALIENIQLTEGNFWINKRNLQRIIIQAKPYRNLYCGSKSIGAHLFRHNWVKKQIQSGKQIATIDAMLGYTSQTIADTYLPSIIKSTQ